MFIYKYIFGRFKVNQRHITSSGFAQINPTIQIKRKTNITKIAFHNSLKHNISDILIGKIKKARTIEKAGS